MMVSDLKKVVDNKEIYFWTDAFGHIKYPSSQFIVHKKDSLPKELKELYEIAHEESYDTPLNVFVTSHRGVNGICLTALYDEEWYLDLFDMDKVLMHPMDFSRKCECILYIGQYLLWDKAIELSKNPYFEDCEFFVGDKTSENDHQLVMFVPYLSKDKFHEIRKQFEKCCWTAKEKKAITEISNVINNNKIKSSDAVQGKQYQLIAVYDNNIVPLGIFSVLEKAQVAMKKDFMRRLSITEDEFKEFIEMDDTECEMNDFDAWANHTGNLENEDSRWLIQELLIV